MKAQTLTRPNPERRSVPRAERALLHQPQGSLNIEARMRATDAGCAAMAHQLEGSLGVLLRYLYEIKRQTERSLDIDANQGLIGEVARRALRETERARNVMERINHALDASADATAAVVDKRAPINAHTSPGATLMDRRLLTPREKEVLALISGGASNNKGSLLLGISTRTFEAHRAHIMGKLGARNAADLVRIGRRASR